MCWLYELMCKGWYLHLYELALPDVCLIFPRPLSGLPILREKTTFFELKNSSLLLAFKYSPYEIVHNRTCVFQRSGVLQV